MAQRLRGPIWRPTISKLEQKFTMKIRFRSTQSREKLPGSAKSFIFCVSIFFICSTVFYSTSSLDCYQTDSQSFQSLLHRPIRTRMNERTNVQPQWRRWTNWGLCFPPGVHKGGEKKVNNDRGTVRFDVRCSFFVALVLKHYEKKRSLYGRVRADFTFMRHWGGPSPSESFRTERGHSRWMKSGSVSTLAVYCSNKKKSAHTHTYKANAIKALGSAALCKTNFTQLEERVRISNLLSCLPG